MLMRQKVQTKIRPYKPVIDSDSDLWKRSVSEDKVTKKQLETPQYNRYDDSGSEKIKGNESEDEE